MTRRTSITAVLVAATGALVLVACGGGGGGGGGSAGDGPSPSAPSTVAEFRDSSRSAVYGKVRNARVGFGSAWVATGAAVTGVDTTFDGQAATATLPRGSARTIDLDSAGAYADSGTQASVTGLPNRSSRTRYVFDRTADSATLGNLTVDWSDGDARDYLAGGYWLHVEAAPFSLQAGAFVDGPELSLDDPPSLPITGSATYRGAAAGLYAARYGTDILGVPAGSEELGEFLGTASLTADFGAGTIGGCVGCVGDIQLSGIRYDSETGEQLPFDFPSDYRVAFGSVSFDRANATFQGTDVTLSHPRVTVTESTGRWGGQFSNRRDGSGDPRLVAGAFGGEASTGGGTQTVFVGAFAAGRR